jgi:hypothetical protein
MQLRNGVEHVRGHGNDSRLAVLGHAWRTLQALHVHVRPFQLEQFPLAWGISPFPAPSPALLMNTFAATSLRPAGSRRGSAISRRTVMNNAG